MYKNKIIFYKFYKNMIQNFIKKNMLINNHKLRR